jgi:hypothetical protein
MRRSWTTQSAAGPRAGPDRPIGRPNHRHIRGRRMPRVHGPPERPTGRDRDEPAPEQGPARRAADPDTSLVRAPPGRVDPARAAMDRQVRRTPGDRAEPRATRSPRGVAERRSRVAGSQDRPVQVDRGGAAARRRRSARPAMTARTRSRSTRPGRAQPGTARGAAPIGHSTRRNMPIRGSMDPSTSPGRGGRERVASRLRPPAQRLAPRPAAMIPTARRPATRRPAVHPGRPSQRRPAARGWPMPGRGRRRQPGADQERLPARESIRRPAKATHLRRAPKVLVRRGRRHTRPHTHRHSGETRSCRMGGAPARPEPSDRRPPASGGCR